MHFNWYFTEVFPKGQKPYSIIGSDNGSAPTRRHAIIWSGDGKFIVAYMRHSASMSSWPEIE